MLDFFFVFFIAWGLSVVISGLSFFLGKKLVFSRGMASSFECGFSPLGSGRLQFSVRFFMITLVFIIFDAEIILLLPLMVVENEVLFISWLLMSMFFMIVLVGGVLYEYSEGVLSWKF